MSENILLKSHEIQLKKNQSEKELIHKSNRIRKLEMISKDYNKENILISK